MNIKKELLTLEQFINSNIELEKLNSKLKEFNPFNILRINEFEIRHSNVLAWLLDPCENHNLGDKILKNILFEIFKRSEDEDISHTPDDVKINDYADCEVRREWKHIDLLIVSKRNRLVLLIENKVNAKEGNDQLRRYIDTVEEEFGDDYEKVFVYLTKDGDEPSLPKYIPISYKEVCGCLKESSELFKENLNEKVLDFINYYIKVLEVITMEDQELIKTCKQIYKKYKEALDLIYEYGVTSSFDSTFDDFIIKNNVIESTRPKNEFWFIPSSFNKQIPQIIKHWKSSQSVSYFFKFDKDGDKISLFAEIAPFEDLQLRSRFIKYLTDKGYDVKSNALKNPGGYIKFYSAKSSYKGWEDEDSDKEILEIMNNLYNNAKKKHENLLEDLKEFDWQGKTVV